MPANGTDSPRDLAAALHALAAQLLVDGQGADTLPARDTAAKVSALAQRADAIAGSAWTLRGKAR